MAVSRLEGGGGGTAFARVVAESSSLAFAALESAPLWRARSPVLILLIGGGDELRARCLHEDAALTTNAPAAAVIAVATRRPLSRAFWRVDATTTARATGQADSRKT